MHCRATTEFATTIAPAQEGNTIIQTTKPVPMRRGALWQAHRKPRKCCQTTQIGKIRFINCSTDYQARENAVGTAEAQACKEQSSDCGAEDAVQEAAHGDGSKEEWLSHRMKYSHASLVKTKIRIGKKLMVLMTRCWTQRTLGLAEERSRRQ